MSQRFWSILNWRGLITLSIVEITSWRGIKCRIYLCHNSWRSFVLAFILLRIIWLVVILLCCAGIGYTCAYQWNRYEANPTVISLERDYRNWNGTLPSVTLCYAIKIDPTKAENYIKRSFAMTQPSSSRLSQNWNLFILAHAILPLIGLGILHRTMTTTAILWISSNPWRIWHWKTSKHSLTTNRTSASRTLT